MKTIQSQLGLRTLVVARKKLTESEVTHFLEQKEQNKRDSSALTVLYSTVEQNLTPVGCTGIDDELQDGVAETLAALKSAGIKIWMLTGDKLETAVNIGVSCGLVPPEIDDQGTQRVVLKEFCDRKKLNTQLEDILYDYFSIIFKQFSCPIYL